ncbi:MAG: type II toxin-antitoxin system HicB family antitoxin [Chloroflexota bacterium]
MDATKRITSDGWAFTVVVEPDTDDGGYVVHCPSLKGCWSQGETMDEALHNIVDAISGWLAAHIERSLDIPRISSAVERLGQPLTLSVHVP